MAPSGKFTSETIETLCKRAALLCSNPDCGALTSGPTAGETGAVNIGEAAHIYGRMAASARYKADLTISEVADITNGIWLCRNCHKSVDNDPLRYPAELLFQWRRRHEDAVSERLGKPGERMQEILKAEQLKPFQGTSYLAQRIVLDRPPHWEFKLTNELLRSGLGSIYKRWRHLKDGLYVRKSSLIPEDQFPDWMSAKFDDASKIIGPFQPLLKELQNAWGLPGVPGNADEILVVCNLMIAAAQNLLDWEEDIRFCRAPERYGEIVEAMRGAICYQLEEIMRIPDELSKVLSDENPSGKHKINLVFDVPKDFQANLKAALDRATEKEARKSRWW